MKIQLLSVLIALQSSLPAGDPGLDVAAVLDEFHRAASAADAERYFGHMTPDGVFIGTDADERWSVSEFRAYAEPYFSKGRGWTYVASERHVSLSTGGEVAWFDERLQNEKYGEVRGSGVLELRDKAWRIAQYNLSFPVPNGDAPELVAKVAKAERVGNPRGEQLFASDGDRQLALWNRVVPTRLELPPKERPVIVLLPSASLAARGLWDLPLDDHSVMRALARRGFDVFAVELGGYGLSSPPVDDAAGGAVSACRDLGIALEYIAELRGTERVVLVGPSWGAQVAGKFAMEHPELVRGVVLYGFSWRTRIPREVIEQILGEGVLEATSRRLDRAQVVGDFIPGMHTEEMPGAFADFVLSQGRTAPTGPLRDFVERLPLVEPERLAVPTLMIAGRQEYVVPDPDAPGGSWVDEERRGEQREFYARLKGPRHWIELSGGGHLAHLENPKVLFQRCLAGWVERLPE
jgi:pimeloyl-ACP methyl ester carboxylesterase